MDDRAEQTEALVNTHVMRNNNVTVNDIAKRDGGDQNIKVGTAKIDLEFTDDDKLLTFAIRRPTEEELNTLQVHWITPRIPDTSSELLRQSTRRNRASVVAENPKNWGERMANPPEMVMAKTLEATTQLCAEPVEMENRESPRQHRKQRLIALHPRRLEGRTDSDTFFASVKSVRGYTCIQIFVHLAANLLFARCMKREAHSHGAYQDFVREVGAPNVLLTDNSQTQTGQKWTKTSRDNITKQINSTPHNQNQNQAELKIRDVKKKVVLTLRKAMAPLVFWCYCMLFVIDCHNHTAHKNIDWQVPIAIHEGSTTDISKFRFAFWEAVWYYEPTAKYPEPNMLPGRFVGLANNVGDAFTYKIWTTPNGNWEDGLELVRNIVKSRDNTDVLPKRDDSIYDAFDLKKKESRKKNKSRKRKAKATSESATVSDVPQEKERYSAVKFNLTPQVRETGSTTPEEQGKRRNH